MDKTKQNCWQLYNRNSVLQSGQISYHCKVEQRVGEIIISLKLRVYVPEQTGRRLNGSSQCSLT